MIGLNLEPPVVQFHLLIQLRPLLSAHLTGIPLQYLKITFQIVMLNLVHQIIHSFPKPILTVTPTCNAAFKTILFIFFLI